MQPSPFAAAGGAALPSFDEEAPSPLEAAWQGLPGAGAHSGRLPSHRGSLDAGAPCFAPPPGGGGASGGLGRSASLPSPYDVAELLARISLLAPPAPPPAGPSAGGPRALAADGSRLHWVQPSGPRRSGQGTEDVEQGVVVAEPTPTGGATLRITLLAAGFIVGPSGACVREVCRASGCDIKSWTAEPDARCPRASRVFRVEGPRAGVARAVGIMCDAVARYKELCEGQYAGQAVPRTQRVAGVDFSYQPPPRHIVPYAAALKGQGSARRSGSLGRQGSVPGGKPPAAPGSRKASGQLGGPPPASAMPAPSPSLARSASLPHPRAARTGSNASADRAGSAGAYAPAPWHRSDSAQSVGAAGAIAEEEEGEQGSPVEAAARHSGSSSSWAAVAAGKALHRSASLDAPRPAVEPAAAAAAVAWEAGEGQQAQQAPAPADKLEKAEVLRSVFGPETAAEYEARPGGTATPAGLAGLLQRLQEAQRAQQGAAAAAAQHGVRGGYELTDPGVLLPASLSPLPAPRALAPAFGGPGAEAALAAAGLAANASMLAAVAAAWQDQQAAPPQHPTHDQLLQLAAAGLLGPQGEGPAPAPAQPTRAHSLPLPLSPYPSLDASAAAAGVAPVPLPPFAVPGGRAGGAEAAAQSQEQLQLSAFGQASTFTPFAAVGSPPQAGGPPPTDYSLSFPPGSPMAPAAAAARSAGPSQPPAGTSGAHVSPQAGPGTPRQPRASIAAMLTPPGIVPPPSAAPPAPHRRAASGGGSLSSAFAMAGAGPGFAPMLAGGASPTPGAGAAHGTPDVGGALASAFALLPGGGGEGGTDGESRPLSPFSAGRFLPLSCAALARAASTPGPQGCCTPMDRLEELVALARANSYSASGEPPEDALLGLGGLNGLEPAGPPPGPPAGPPAAVEPAAPRRPQPPHAGGSLFASAFSPHPHPACLRAAPSLPGPSLLARPPAGPGALGGQRSASVALPASSSAGDVLGQVDALLASMFQ